LLKFTFMKAKKWLTMSAVPLLCWAVAPWASADANSGTCDCSNSSANDQASVSTEEDQAALLDDTRGRFLDHSSTVAQGGVGNIVDRTDIPRPESESESQGQQAGQSADFGVSSSTSSENGFEQNPRTIVRFDTNQTELDARALGRVQDLADQLKSDPHLQAKIEGYADATGTPQVNREVSAERANSIRDALVSNGVSQSQIQTYEFGSQKPVASNDSDAGRAQNRRAEIYLEDMEAQT
jgi:outer membrane protein OmpA-like peptidoglycan-associated protein